MTPPFKDDELIGQKVGEYNILSRIGVGGMGVVYEGIQPIIGKRVAVKVLRPQLSQDSELVERFLAEARAVNAIRHRGIVDIFSFGELPNGSCYFVMEFLEGQPFDRLIKDRAPLLPYDVMSWLDEVLDALDAVHSTGIVHRDIKPSNLYLVNTGRGRPYVKLLDFGVAKLNGLLGESTPHTKASVLIGTPDYMAPEQAKGKAIGPAADIYALGCVAFEMLTGRRLYVGENPMQVIFMHIEEPSLRVSALVPDAPAELDELVAAMLEKDPARRPPSANEARRMVEAVKRILPSDKTSTYTPAPRSLSRELDESVAMTATPSPSKPRGPLTRVAPPTPMPEPAQGFELGPTRIVQRPKADEPPADPPRVSPKPMRRASGEEGPIPDSPKPTRRNTGEDGPTQDSVPVTARGTAPAQHPAAARSTVPVAVTAAPGGGSMRLFAMLAFFGLATGGLTFGYMVLLNRKPPAVSVQVEPATPAEPSQPAPVEAVKPAEPAKPPPVEAVKPTEPAKPPPVEVAKPVEPQKPPPEPRKPPPVEVAKAQTPEKPVDAPKPADPDKTGGKTAAPPKKHGYSASDLDARLAQLESRLDRKDAQRGSKDRVLHQFLDQAKGQLARAKSDDDRREAWKFLGELDKQIGP